MINQKHLLKPVQMYPGNIFFLNLRYRRSGEAYYIKYKVALSPRGKGKNSSQFSGEGVSMQETQLADRSWCGWATENNHVFQI